MRETISPALRQAASAQQTEEGIYLLVTIEHEDLEEIHRLTDAPVNIMSRDLPFYRAPMTITLAEDSDQKMPQARIVMANVDRRLVAALRSTNKPCNILLELVKISDWDYVEMALPDFILKDVEYDVLVIQGVLSVEGLAAEPAIDYCFTPTIAPGLFS